MAQAGLLFKIYARVNTTTGVPTIGRIITGIFTALVACLVDFESLEHAINAISLGTLQVFTFLLAVIILLPTGHKGGTPYSSLLHYPCPMTAIPDVAFN
jgi:amino acid transporter